MPEPIESLGPILKARRRERRLSLRDLADQIGVSFNTLSRVERGHVPDLKTYERIVDWLDMPAGAFLRSEASTTGAITRRLRSDASLSDEAAAKIADVVEEMYSRLVADQPSVAVHLRSAQTFTPKAGALMADVLGDMQRKLLAGG